MCITGPCKSPAVAYETPQGDLPVIGTSPPMVQPVPIHLNCCLENHSRLDSGSASHCDHGCRYSRSFTVLSLPSFAFKVVEPNQAKWASYYFITFCCKWQKPNSNLLKTKEENLVTYVAKHRREVWAAVKVIKRWTVSLSLIPSFSFSLYRLLFL